MHYAKVESSVDYWSTTQIHLHSLVSEHMGTVWKPESRLFIERNLTPQYRGRVHGVIGYAMEGRGVGRVMTRIVRILVKRSAFI